MRFLNICLITLIFFAKTYVIAQTTNEQTHQTIITSTFDKLFSQYGKKKAINLIRQHFLIEINRERAKYNNKPLVLHDSLNLCSQRHSEDMAKRDFFKHRNPEGFDHADRMEAVHYNYRRAYENITYNMDDIKSIVKGYLTSTTGHKNIIIVGELEDVGFGLSSRKQKFGNETINIWFTTSDYGAKLK